MSGRSNRPNHLAVSAFLLLLLATLSCTHDIRPKVVDAIPRSSSDAMYLSERLGLAQEGGKMGLQLRWHDALSGDIERQIELIDSAVERRSYGIVFNTTAMFATNVALSDAVNHEVPVVIVLGRLPIAPGRHLSYILEDAQASATLVSERLQSRTLGSDDVILMGNEAGTPGTNERFAAMEAALGKSDSATHIVDRIAGPSSLSYYESKLEQSLRAQHVQTIIALNSQAGFAAVEVLRALQLQRAVRVIAFDQSLELELLLHSGEVDSLVVQDTRTMGKLAIDAIEADHEGRPHPGYQYVPPVLVTLENVDSESVQHVLQMN